MIKLHQFAPAFGLPNASPFCMKMDNCLRMAGPISKPIVEAYCQRMKARYYA